MQVDATATATPLFAVEVAGITSDSRFIVDKVALTRATVREELGGRDDSTTFANFA